MNARRWAVPLMIASGFAGLGYQIVWTQQCALWLGHETAAVLAVVAAFFGGLGIGASCAGPRIDASPRPVLWYAVCEGIIGLWALALVFLMAPVSELLLSLLGPQPVALWQWTVVFCGTFLLLLPATAAMGATLPAMERLFAPLRDRGTPVAVLYAANTLGAVIGVLATAFWLIPRLGLSATAAICVAANSGCAMAALRVFDRRSVPARTAPVLSGDVRPHLATLAVTGFLGIGYEVVVIRVVSQVAENTVFTFALLLAVYLGGSTVGAAAFDRWSASLSRDRLLRALTVACLLGIAALAHAPGLKDSAAGMFGAGMSAALAGETALALAAFLLPTLVMGALFSRLATDARAAGISLGRTLGANTFGAALAPLICGVLLLPRLGSTWTLLLLSIGYLLLVSRGSWRSAPQWTAAAAALAAAAWAPSLAFVTIPAGGHLVSYAEGIGAAVSVVEDAQGVTTLHIDNRQQEGSSVTLFADARQGLFPILLHPSPHRALFLGLGTGLTSKSASEDAALEVDAVELLPEVIAASAHFPASEPQHPRLHLAVADARRFVRSTSDRYDVIVADNFHPARSGSGSLYTTEHFAAVRARLTAGGVFCQWLPLHQLDLPTLRSIVQSYRHEFPRSFAMLATNSLETPVIGLVARRDGERFDPGRLRARLASARLPRPLADFGIPDDLALLGSFIAGPGALADFAGGAPLNTDDHPVVSYLAPRVTYAPDERPRDRLLAFVRSVAIRPDELLDDRDAASTRRLAAYWKARNRYLEAGRDVRPSADLRAMLAQVQAPLLSVLELSPDFRPAYDPLFRMATQLESTDAAAARALLVRLVQLQPARGEAAAALLELGR